MTWILTATGASVDLQFIAGADISLLDIAHHLAQINRYTGACSRPYSVAEHSLLVCDLLERQRFVTNPSVLLAALMHDAHEAYTTDLSQPMKQVVGEAWRQVEERVAHAVRRRFGLLTAFTTGAALVKWADLTALSTERAQLLPPTGPVWAATLTHPPVDWDFAQRAGFTWQDWRDAFLERYAELHFARQNAPVPSFNPVPTPAR
jgi:hypothetical protein